MNENDAQDSLIWGNEGIWSFFNFDNSDENSSKTKVPNSNGASSYRSPVLPSRANAPPSKAGRKRVVPSGDDGCEPARLDGHKLTERERRKKMKNMYTNLHSLLPQLPTKVDKTTLVNEAVDYIQTLEQILLNLQKEKMERFQTLNYPPICTSIKPTSDQVIAPKKAAMTLMVEYSGCGSNSVFAPANAENISNLVAPVVLQFPIGYTIWNSQSVALNVCGCDAHINVCCPAKRGLFTTTCHVLDKYKIEVISAHVSSDHHRSMFMIHGRVTTGVAEEIYKQAAEEINQVTCV